MLFLNSVFSAMEFYTSIADYYDEIFPFKQVQKNFINSFDIQGYDSTLLDVGCGTGSLSLNLADSFGTVIAIDPDKEMLHLAKIKAMKFKADHRDQLEDLGNWVFVQKGMLDLSDEFVPDSFNTVLCFGNTLVHLSSKEEVSSFLDQASGILKPGGLLMVQIINYDRIIDQKLTGLPSLENENINFERNYRFDSDPAKVIFHTKLTVKKSGEEIENEISLLAIRPQQLTEMMKEVGFVDIQEFGNFKKDPFTKDSQPFIVVARKE